MGNSKRVELVNLEGYTYKTWHEHAKDLLAKLYGLNLDEIERIDPYKHWQANVSVGTMAGICIGSIPSPFDVEEATYFGDDFPGYEISQIEAGSCT